MRKFRHLLIFIVLLIELNNAYSFSSGAVETKRGIENVIECQSFFKRLFLKFFCNSNKDAVRSVDDESANTLNEYTIELLQRLKMASDEQKPLFSAQLFYNYYRRAVLWRKEQSMIVPLKPQETDLKKVLRYDVNSNVSIYGIDLAHGSKIGWFSGEEGDKRRATMISIVKKTWEEHKAMPSASWHIENPYVPHAYYALGKESRGCIYDAARIFSLHSGKSFLYPESHTNVPREIMEGIQFDDGEMIQDVDGFWLPSNNSTKCGKARMEGDVDLEGFDSPHQWFEAAITDMCSMINEFVDEEGNGIPVILRLYHEPETRFAWWGYGVPKKDYISFFRYTVERIRELCPHKNVLFAYCKDRYWNEKSYGDRYPGDEYVDLVGFDDYTICTSDSSDDAVIKRMRIVSKFAQEHKKVAALFETGNNRTEYSRSRNFLSENLYRCITAEGVNLGLVQIWSTFTTEGDEKILNDYKAFLQKPAIQTVNHY